MVINLSPAQFRRPELRDMIKKAVSSYHLDNGSLEIDIAESTLVEDADSSLKTLNALKKNGVRLAIDDFGTGFSSIANLKHFPVDTVKIHESFVEDLHN